MKYKKLIFILVIITVSVYLIDTFTSGFLDMIYNILFTTYEYTAENGIVYINTQPRLDILKLLVLVIIILCVSVCYLYIERNRKYDKKMMILQHEKILAAFRDHRPMQELHKDYANIEKTLMEIQNQQVHQMRMLELETRQKNDLISYLAHDMKTPLASVIGYLSLLDDVKDIPQEQKEHYVEITLDKANRLEFLIDEFFDITRFNLHDIVLSQNKIQLNFMFQQLCEQFYPILMKQGKEIDIQMEDNLVLYADADKLARAFNNILKNAISYSYENSKIVVKAVCDIDNVHITFHNQGDEIPQQKLQTIFEKFYRLDAARSTHAGGSGLGLAIAKEIMNAHGGSISAQSSFEETVFEVILPMNRKQEQVL
ncbi:sensor histidine kinase [Amedibacillus sp. YH-ame6]